MMEKCILHLKEDEAKIKCQKIINIYIVYEMIKFKAKDSELTSTTLCLGNISYDFSVSNMKKIGLYGTVYEFSADYGAISVDNTLNIHKYLMKKYNKK